jgi:hypothetical protein
MPDKVYKAYEIDHTPCLTSSKNKQFTVVGKLWVP